MTYKIYNIPNKLAGLFIDYISKRNFHTGLKRNQFVMHNLRNIVTGAHGSYWSWQVTAKKAQMWPPTTDEVKDGGTHCRVLYSITIDRCLDTNPTGL